MNLDDQMENVPSSGEEEDNIDDRKHHQLLDAISSLDGKKRSKLSQRTVISNQISEFNFTSSKDESSRIKLHELVGSLKESTSHGDLKKQLRDIEKNKETVTTPLPKHEKEKLDRSTAYESASQDISKWDPIVQKNRKAEQLQFPLQKQSFRIVTTDQFVKRFQPRTPLEQEVAALLRGSDNVIHHKAKELTAAEQRALKAMDLDEAKLRRMELMKHRALLSYKEAKAKRQKKIKSKKYHRILKKERVKVERKLMDKMKEEDPEGFIDKLNQVEKDRAEERMSLKHRGASKFGKRQAIYAKYDDRARQEVQDMLQKSRELTKKVDIESDSDNEEMYPDTGVADDVDEAAYTSLKPPSNPWMARSSKHQTGVKSARDSEDVNADSDDDIDKSEYSRPQEFRSKENIGSESDDEDEIENDKNDKSGSVKAGNDNLRNMKKIEVHDLSSITEDSIAASNKKPKVNILRINDVIDDIFEKNPSNNKRPKRENKKIKMRHRIAKVKQRKAEMKNKAKKEEESVEHESDSEDGSDDGSNAEKGLNNEVDEEMGEDSDDDETNNESLKRKQTLEDLEDNTDEDENENVVVKRQKLNAKKKKKGKKTVTEEKVTTEKEAFVDPKKLFTLESKLRQSGSGPAIVDNDDEGGDMDEDEQQRMTIAQAFADDDVIEEFTKDKGEVIEKGKPKDIDLTLPGWGSWGGEGVKVSRRKRKRYTIKAPPALPRKDEHLGHVIINEAKIAAVTKHQVHEIPFPYVNAEQFETSIRAPLGKTWNPETVTRDLTKPRVVTTLGKVITPIDKSEVFKDKKNKSKAMTDGNSDTVNDKRDKKGKSGKGFGGNKSGKGSNKTKLKKNAGKKTRK